MPGTMSVEQPATSRRQRDDIDEPTFDHDHESVDHPAKRRRVFLQTMGQQLREVGVGDGSRETVSTYASSSIDNSNINGTPRTDRPHGRQVHIQTPESDAVPGEEEEQPTGATLSASKLIWRPNEVLVASEENGIESLTFDDLIDWTRSYFDNWHPAYPFLHAPSILKYFDHVVDHGVFDLAGSSTHERTIFRSIMSISLADRRQTGVAMKAVPSQFIFTSVNDAIQNVQCLLTDESTVLALQAVVSVQLFLISMLRYNAASRLAGLAVRMVFHLGLHRCPMQFSQFHPKEVELRQRLFWSIFCIDRYICIRLGIPLAIRDADVDVCFPTSERHGDNLESKTFDNRRLDLLRFLARHTELRGSISELRNKSVSNRSTEFDETIAINAELTKWWNEVEEYLDSNDSAPVPISRYHRTTLIVLRHEATIALNKQILATSRNISAYNSALQNCIGAARSIINTLHNTLKTGLTQEASYSDSPSETTALLWPSFTWAVWMSSFLMIYAANEGEVPQDVAIRFIDNSLEVLKHLTLRASLWPKACAAGLRDLKSRLIERRNRSKHTNLNSRNSTRQGQQPNNFQLSRSTAVPENAFSGSAQNQAAAGDSERIQASQTNPHRLNQYQSTQSNTFSNTEFTEANNLVQGDAPEAGLPPFVNRMNWMLSDHVAHWGDGESATFNQRFGSDLVHDLQLPNYEGSDLIYGLDPSFWLRNGTWTDGNT